MNFREFAAKNVQRNAKAYYAYFFSSTISAALLFSYTMIIFHPGFKIDMLPRYLKNSLYITTVIAYLFLCLFVFYSISVFLKSRYKEFGILYILGSSKKQLQKMIRIENMIISSAAAVTGLIIGIIFSKVLLAASGKLLGYNALEFYFPTKAMTITLSAFIFIGMLSSVFCAYIIREDKVLSLLKGTKRPRTEPNASVILAIICTALLIIGYFLSITSNESTISYRIIPVTAMIIIATYLLFSQLSVFIIKLMKKNRNLYMKKTTVLWVSNLLYRIKDNTRMFFLITITSTVALTAIGSVYAYWRDKEHQIDRDFPYAFFYSDVYNNIDRVDLKADFIESSLKNKGLPYSKVNEEFKYVIVKGEKGEVVIIKEGSYEKLASLLNLNIAALNDNETIIASSIIEYGRKNIIVDNTKLKVAERSSKEILPAFYGDVFIVKDDIYEKVKGERCYFNAINVENYKGTLDICNNYYNKFGSDDGNKTYTNFLKAHILESTKIGYGTILFSAIFIGLIFFATTGSFLYNKCYMDVIEDKNKYKQLYKIGLTYKEIKKILNIEIGVLFLLPYLIAVIHFFFAISSLKYAFDIAITVPALQLIGVMMIAQIIYFCIVRKSYLLEVKKGLA